MIRQPKQSPSQPGDEVRQEEIGQEEIGQEEVEQKEYNALLENHCLGTVRPTDYKRSVSQSSRGEIDDSNMLADLRLLSTSEAATRPDILAHRIEQILGVQI